MNVSDKGAWKELQAEMSRWPFLKANPVLYSLKAKSMNTEQGVGVLKQYFYLVATIVQFLAIAMARIPVQAVKTELKRNLQEELGSRTNSVSHQELLETLLYKELGVSARTKWNHATQEFICKLLTAFNTRAPHFVAGMVYALEATACPELLVVGQIINAVAQREVVDMAKLQDEPTTEDHAKSATLQDFLAMHTLDFEVGHESGLRQALDEYAQTDWAEFLEGFFFVLVRMKNWWDKLALSEQ